MGGDAPIWCGKVAGAAAVEYGIIGESLQNAWYRFGVGVDDAVTGAGYFAAGLELAAEERLEQARRLERVMRSRAVQILYHLFAVARNTDQGVVGSVLTEYHMEEQHGENLAEARLRDVAREGAEMLAVVVDLRGADADPLLEPALDFVRASCCRRAVELLGCFQYPCEQLTQAQKPLIEGRHDWADRTREVLAGVLAPKHHALLAPLFANAEPREPDGKQRQERLIELAAGRYHWVSPWLRACALRALDSSAPNAIMTLMAAAGDRENLVAEVARAALDPSVGKTGARPAVARSSTLERVLVLKQVSIFEAIPHELLADVAVLLTERAAIAGARIIEKGEPGDSLYIIAAGRVRVHDGDRDLREMTRNEFFGELSLLDSEPRTASVTAVEPTLLFRLAQDDFYAAMRERPEISRALNRALCRLIRSA